MTDQLLETVLEIKELLKLIAEPQLAQKYEKQRAALKSIVGKSTVKARAIFLLDGSRAQSEIPEAANMDKSDVSKLIKALRAAELLKQSDNPTLSIQVPSNFFDAEDKK